MSLGIARLIDTQIIDIDDIVIDINIFKSCEESDILTYWQTKLSWHYFINAGRRHEKKIYRLLRYVLVSFK